MKKSKLRKRLGFVPKATGKVSHGHGMGMTISCRGHEIFSDRKKGAARRRCRGPLREDD